MIPTELDASPDLKRAFDLVNEANMSSSELEAQHKRKEFIMIQRTAIEKATDNGRTSAIVEIAKNLLDVLDDATISVKTGLTVLEVAKLRQ